MNFQSNIIEVYRHNSYITLKTVDFNTHLHFAEMTGGGGGGAGEQNNTEYFVVYRYKS